MKSIFKILFINLFIFGVLTSCSSYSKNDRLPAFTANVSCLSGFKLYKKRRFVNTPEDFKRHTELHVKRVQRIAKEIIREFPESFPLINKYGEDLFTKFIRLHDKAKIDNDIWLKEKKVPILKRLFKYYGRPLKEFNEVETIKMKSIVSELNEHDHEIVISFFVREGIMNEDRKMTDLAQELLKIEKLSDIVDRAMSEVSPEEFAREMIPASDFVNSSQDRKLLLVIENRYIDITKGLSFIP